MLEPFAPPPFDIDKISATAAIELKVEERVEIEAAVCRILEHLNSLAAVNLDNVPPTIYGAEGTCRLRADRIEDGVLAGRAVAASPSASRDLFKVPKIVE